MERSRNRREYARERKVSRVRFSMVGSDEYQDGQLVDLGEGGLCMEASSPLRTGETIYIQLMDMNPDVSGLEAQRSFRGRVRWTRDLGCIDKTRFGIGVQYTRPVSDQ